MKAKLIQIISFLVFSCGFVEKPEQINQNVVYQNSFETAHDTMNWFGEAVVKFSIDHYEDDGRQSIYISGTCFVPHFKYIFKPLKQDGNYIVTTYAKCLHNSGVLVLRVENDTARTEIWIRDTDWKFYESSDTLFCPANSSLSIELVSGGIVKGEMLVDNLKLIKTK